jgi:hypothetical protein
MVWADQRLDSHCLRSFLISFTTQKCLEWVQLSTFVIHIYHRYTAADHVVRNLALIPAIVEVGAGQEGGEIASPLQRAPGETSCYLIDRLNTKQRISSGPMCGRSKEISNVLFAAARTHHPIALGFWKGKRGFTLSLVKKART